MGFLLESGNSNRFVRNSEPMFPIQLDRMGTGFQSFVVLRSTLVHKLRYRQTESALTVDFFTLAKNVKLDVLIFRIRLKKATGVILELQTHKSKN